MTEQKLTISGLYRPGWHRWPELGQVAYLPLAGRWLTEAGFPVGARVTVEAVEDGRLVVPRVDEGEEPARWPAGRPRRRRSRSRRRSMGKEYTVSYRRYEGTSSCAPEWKKRHRRPETFHPLIRLSGRWLAGLGFPLGAKIEVEAEPGRLVLQACRTGGVRGGRARGEGWGRSREGPRRRGGGVAGGADPGGGAAAAEARGGPRAARAPPGVGSRPRGEDLMGLCPFHDDTEPSLVVSPGRTSGTAWGPAGRAARSSTG